MELKLTSTTVVIIYQLTLLQDVILITLDH
jgi:hypothetical protein